MDREGFLSQLTEALEHLEDPRWLDDCSLAHRLVAGAVTPGAQLASILHAAIRELRPMRGHDSNSPDWRQYRHLSMRYTLGIKPRQIAEELNVSERQARRDHLDGLHALAERLWRTSERLSGESTAAPGSGYVGHVATSEQEALEYDEMVQTEVTRLGAISAATPTPVESTVRGALSTVSALAAGRGITLSVHAPSQTCFVAVDHAALRQILLNILTYLIEDCHSTHFSLTIAESNDRVDITFASTSSGELTPSVSSRLTPSSPTLWTGAQTYSVPSITNQTQDTRPLDDTRLDICRRLLATQSGTLRVSADAGKPSGASISLPAMQTATVLVIDDNPDFFRLFQRYLGDQTFRVHFASTGDKAIQLTREIRPDVITLDVMMPTQDGWEILQRLKSDAVSRYIPVIVCSVLREEALARSLGAADFLPKPIRQQSLLAALDRCCGRGVSSDHRA